MQAFIYWALKAMAAQEHVAVRTYVEAVLHHALRDGGRSEDNPLNYGPMSPGVEEHEPARFNSLSESVGRLAPASASSRTLPLPLEEPVSPPVVASEPVQEPVPGHQEATVQVSDSVTVQEFLGPANPSAPQPLVSDAELAVILDSIG